MAQDAYSDCDFYRNMRTINKNTNLFNAHGVDNIKDEQIFI